MVTFCTRKSLWISSLVLLFPALSTLAQTKAPQETWSLPTLIDSAMRHLPVLQQKKALIDAARAGVIDARHAYLPASFIGDEVSLGTDNAMPGSYYSFGLIPSVSGGINPANNSQAATGNIAFLFNEYELVNFGLKKATIHQAEAGVNVSQADFEREKYLLKWQIGKLFLDIRKYEFQLGIDSLNVDRYQTLYKVIQAVTKSGIKPGADSALAMAELSDARTLYNQTHGQIRQLYAQLSYLTGLPVDGLMVDTTGTQSNLSAPGFANRGLSNNLPLSDSGATANPLTDYYLKQRTLYLQTEDLVKKSFLPKILLTGITWARGSGINSQDKYGSAGAGLGYQRFNYLAGVTFQYNLFNMVHRRDKAAIIHNELIASDYDLKQQQLSLQNVGNKAEEGIRTALQNLQEIPIQIRSAEDAYAQKTAQYRAGIINLVDLTNASFVLYRSQSAFVQTVSDWLLSNLDRSAADGNLDLFIQSIK
jgi:outer membrane protein TolC